MNENQFWFFLLIIIKKKILTRSVFTYHVNRIVIICSRIDTTFRAAVTVGAITWLSLQWAIVIHHDLFNFCTDQTSELNEATMAISFKSLRVALIPAVLPGCIIDLLSWHLIFTKMFQGLLLGSLFEGEGFVLWEFCLYLCISIPNIYLGTRKMINGWVGESSELTERWGSWGNKPSC